MEQAWRARRSFDGIDGGLEDLGVGLGADTVGSCPEESVEGALDMIGRGNDESPGREVRRQAQRLLWVTGKAVAEQHEGEAATRWGQRRVLEGVGRIGHVVARWNLRLQCRGEETHEVDDLARVAFGRIRASGIPDHDPSAVCEPQGCEADGMRTAARERCSLCAAGR
jgi:hypothetical protein